MGKIIIPIGNHQFEGRIGSPIIDKNDAKLSLHASEHIILAGSFSNTEIKLYEADFFIKFIEQNASHHALILYGLSAFLTAARSITLFLQAECNGKTEFDQWYASKRKLLKENEFAKFLLTTRNNSAHKMYAKITIILERQAVSDETLVGFEFDRYQFTPGLGICKDYLKLLEEIIIEAKEKGFLSVDPNHGHKVRFTLGGLTTK